MLESEQHSRDALTLQVSTYMNRSSEQVVKWLADFIQSLLPHTQASDQNLSRYYGYSSIMVVLALQLPHRPPPPAATLAADNEVAEQDREVSLLRVQFSTTGRWSLMPNGSLMKH